MKTWILWVIISTLFLSCGGEEEPIEDIEKPNGSDRAMAVYNQAYNENYEPDQLSYISLNAQKAYILLDPFDQDVSNAIPSLQANGNQVGAYISIGTGEDYRDDFSQLQPYLAEKQWGEWPGEYFINQPTQEVINIMKARIDKIAEWGFDWVEFDNMDWAMDEDNIAQYNLEVTEAASASYFQTLCEYVHQKGMKCMAKNTTDYAEDFDGATYESYHEEKNWWDESGAKSFLNSNKLVVIVHYNEGNCNRVYADYMNIYNDDISYICEDNRQKKYVHYNDD